MCTPSQLNLTRFIDSPFGPNGMEALSRKRAARRARLIASIERDVAYLSKVGPEQSCNADGPARSIRAYRTLIRCAILIHAPVDLAPLYDPWLEKSIAVMPHLPADQKLRTRSFILLITHIAHRSGASCKEQAGAALSCELACVTQFLAANHWQEVADAATSMLNAKYSERSMLKVMRSTRSIRRILQFHQAQ